MKEADEDNRGNEEHDAERVMAGVRDVKFLRKWWREREKDFEVMEVMKGKKRMKMLKRMNRVRMKRREERGDKGREKLERDCR